MIDDISAPFMAEFMQKKRTRRKTESKSKNPYYLRRKAEMDARKDTIWRHRRDETRRQYPALFAEIDKPSFKADYEALTGEPWNQEWEAQIVEVRARIALANGIIEKAGYDAARRFQLLTEYRMETDPGRRRWKLQALATPAWANIEAIKAVYRERDRLQQETGITHHVDHIYPIQSHLVCGLHVEFNLRAIPASENYVKSNRLPVHYEHG